MSNSAALPVIDVRRDENGQSLLRRELIAENPIVVEFTELLINVHRKYKFVFVSLFVLDFSHENVQCEYFIYHCDFEGTPTC
jgi:hypothetical protein